MTRTLPSPTMHCASRPRLATPCYNPSQICTSVSRFRGEYPWLLDDGITYHYECNGICTHVSGLKGLHPCLTRRYIHKPGIQNRTDNRLFTRQVLCRLGYTGIERYAMYRARTCDLSINKSSALPIELTELIWRMVQDLHSLQQLDRLLSYCMNQTSIEDGRI